MTDDCCRKRTRNEDELHALQNRLNRIEGQIKGIRGMLESDAYCIDILNQVSAAQSALGSFGRLLLEQHLRTCVSEDIRSGKDDALDELISTLKRFMK